MNKNLIPIAEGAFSTLLGMNGGCPESPDGKLIVYARKEAINDREKNLSEVWICNTDLTNHRKVFDSNIGNHNSISATFIDNNRIVFRSRENRENVIYIVNVHTGKTEYGPIIAKEGHRAEKCKFPFSITDGQIGKNPNYESIGQAGVYWLDCMNGEVKKLFNASDMLDAILKAGYTPNEHTTSLSHVQLNPSATKVMMRIGVDGSGGALLGCRDLITGEFYFIPNKPVHQLWYDDDSYMAVYQYHDGTKWVMNESRINRYSVTGEVIEPLGGIGNHVDGSPDRQLFVGDSMYPGEDIRILLYEKGSTKPLQEFDSHRFFIAAWDLAVHSNPSFSADGKRVYFNRPVSDEKTVAVFAEVSL